MPSARLARPIAGLGGTGLGRTKPSPEVCAQSRTLGAGEGYKPKGGRAGRGDGERKRTDPHSADSPRHAPSPLACRKSRGARTGPGWRGALCSVTALDYSSCASPFQMLNPKCSQPLTTSVPWAPGSSTLSNPPCSFLSCLKLSQTAPTLRPLSCKQIKPPRSLGDSQFSAPPSPPLPPQAFAIAP